ADWADAVVPLVPEAVAAATVDRCLRDVEVASGEEVARRVVEFYRR
ncbi:MAG: hypothetical protein RL199_1843, partial [Pseudomonadota bacterium]